MTEKLKTETELYTLDACNDANQAKIGKMCSVAPMLMNSPLGEGCPPELFGALCIIETLIIDDTLPMYRKLQNITIIGSPNLSNKYDVYYRVYTSDNIWSEWRKFSDLMK